jgi:ABC-type nitrate/sulfonate/bicarbonate transport system ATPase subunit
VSIIGPSGCGKSTLLNVIAGLESPTEGSVALDGDVDAGRLGQVAYMHQRDLLLPWRTVLENARLGLELQGVRKREADTAAEGLMHRFGLAGFERAYPWRLSGGMRQRVALLRAVLPDRGVLLLDEPFGALDALTRSQLQEWLGEALDREDKAVVQVTHDVEEALLLSDRVYVMTSRPGHIRDEVTVDLPRPRHRDTVTDARFVDLKARLMAALSASRTEVAG